ncbi:M56 family metallopeptidase [Leucobacter sp. UT-8R-CII-1-4]|uniref:M56 family metallopeptidase n=1 Tax=Leucobacter sp. UT-8R-CII-1-4 TaxID=3040075 RepID=UPI0024A94EC6|nr:M56 family metallopeptidase [Leucobacter sp. UT-8R-CII-1-4]MDI6024070.1 M56 family metallopeptidase [Leucobacter sp. UT-8R-CII-1-4]
MLWIVLACFGSALIMSLLAPLVLTIGRWQLLHPRTALTAWFGALFTGVALILAGLAISVIGAVSAPDYVGGTESLLLTVVAWFGLGVFGAVATMVSVSSEPIVEARREALKVMAPVARSREARQGFILVRFDSDEAVAFAVPGRRPEIFISSAVEDLLSKAQLGAVLAHEYAHLRHHHGWALRIAAVNAFCLGRLRPGRDLHRATKLLVELAADDAAARQAGAANLANALTLLAESDGDAGMRLRATRLTSKRWPSASRRRLPKALAATVLP